MNGVQLRLHLPRHASIYLDMLLLHVQNLIWQVNKSVLQFTFCIDHQ